MPLVGALADAPAIAAIKHAPGGTQIEALPRLPGLYASGGMASRGLTWAAMAGEIIASDLAGDPMPVEADLLESVDPARFLARRLRRGA
jgi:tRNA 5-methylaminomethyl-2-thiouridine biosynthesis bifunctional protein